MHVDEMFFAFTHPKWERIWQDPLMVFGHVQAFGFTEDETWLFVDPVRTGLDIRIMHRHDEVEARITHVAAQADALLMLEAPRKMRIPPFVPATCVGVCGYMAGVRAFTPTGLERKLRAMNAKDVLHEIRTNGI